MERIENFLDFIDNNLNIFDRGKVLNYYRTLNEGLIRSVEYSVFKERVRFLFIKTKFLL